MLEVETRLEVDLIQRDRAETGGGLSEEVVGGGGEGDELGKSTLTARGPRDHTRGTSFAQLPHSTPQLWQRTTGRIHLTIK